MVMFLELTLWWYSKGWLKAFNTALKWVNKVQMEFSVPVLLGTLFSPWKQIVSLPGKSLDDKFRAMIDNLVSRFIGFIVRLLVLLAALVLMALAAAAGLVMVAAWPFAPLAVVYLTYRSVKG